MITTTPLSIDELGQLSGFLLRYKTELEYEAHDGALLGESEEDARHKAKALESVRDCLKTVREDLQFHLYEL